MRSTTILFHLAIPAKDLGEMKEFYEAIGCEVARQYDDRITLNFFGDQVVCHLSDRYDREPEMYPRHFGLTFREKEDFDQLLNRAKEKNLTFFSERATRFADLREKHETFFLRDPSNNLLEFKYYYDSSMMY